MQSRRLAVVTGGSRGIGAAIALRLSREGLYVIAASRSGGEPRDKSRRHEHAGPIETAVVDTTSQETVDRLFSSVLAAHGRVDVLVNNAAAFDAAAALSLSAQAWVNHFDVKAAGYGRCVAAVLPSMRASGWGRIVNIGGIATRMVTETTAGMINAAICNLTALVSREGSAHGITANVVHPGVTETDRHRLLMAARADAAGTTVDEEAARLSRALPGGRLVQPEEVAALVAFLVSDEAAAITGQSIAVDRGLAGSIQY